MKMFKELYENYEREADVASFLSAGALVAIYFSIIAYTKDSFLASCIYVGGLGLSPLMVLISFLLISSAREIKSVHVKNISDKEMLRDILATTRFSIFTNLFTIVLFVLALIALFERLLV